MTDFEIRADGAKNGRVTPEVKELLSRWLEERGVPDARQRILCYHYLGGEFVALSDHGPGRSDRFDELRQALADAHPENRITSDTCVWVSWEWIGERI